MNIDNYNLEVVEQFIYLGTDMRKTNNISLDLKRKILLANRCYFGLSKQVKNKDISRQTKHILHNTLILPKLLYGADAWIVMQADKAFLRGFERKILHKINGLICVRGENGHGISMSAYNSWLSCTPRLP